MRVNKKMRRGALRSALTDTLASGKLAVVNAIAFEAPRTKDAVALLAALELEGKVLVVLPEPTDDGTVELSFRNLPNAKVAYAGGLGVYDLLNADRVLFTVAALDALEGKTETTSQGSEDA
jgi:large subunit ribosomal protein L4